MLVALTRGVSPAIDRCELTHLDREPIDLERARRQHREYELALEGLGYRVERLPAEPEFPDSVFVEDVALVLPEVAIITRPGAGSRRGELPSIERALAPYRRIERIGAPGVLDGGDVLALGKRLFVGLSTRSNTAAAQELAALVADHGYTVTEVEFRGCLHLKSAVTAIGDDAVVLNPEWVDPGAFPGVRCLEVDPGEPAAGNVLLAGSVVLAAAEHPRTAKRIEGLGIEVRVFEAAELAKAEGGLTCCSLLFETA